MKGNSLHDLKWRNSWNLFMNDFYSWWVPWHHISNLSWRAPSRLTVQAAWITGACLVCLGHGLPGMIAHDPWYTTPPDNERLHEKTNETTTTTTHKYVWVSMIYMIVFKGTKGLSLFLQRSIRGCYGLNHMPWKSIGSHWLRGFPARLAARGWKQWNCTWWARD